MPTAAAATSASAVFTSATQAAMGSVAASRGLGLVDPTAAVVGCAEWPACDCNVVPAPVEACGPLESCRLNTAAQTITPTRLSNSAATVASTTPPSQPPDLFGR